MHASSYGSLRLPSALLALVIITAGCGKDATLTAPSQNSGLSQQAADDVARHFAGSLSQGAVPLNRIGSADLAAIARGEVRLDPSGRAYRTTDEGSFTWSFSVRFFDADGNEQASFDPLTTARMSVVARARGSLTTAEHQATIGVHRALDIDGLLPTETTLEIDGAANDTADAAFEARDGSASRSYHLLGAGALTDVMQLKDSSVNPYPLSGTARWEVEIDAAETDQDGTREAHYEVTVLVTFNGTRNPTIEIDGNFRYSMDLVTGEIRRLPA